MKEFELNKDAWHFKIATFGETRYEKELLTEHGTDICEYIRKFIRGVFSIGIISIASIFLIGFCGIAVYDLWAILFAGGGMTSPLIVFTAVVLAILVFLAIVFFKDLHRKWKAKAPSANERQQDSFLSLTYQKFKTKTCSKIVFK